MMEKMPLFYRKFFLHQIFNSVLQHNIRLSHKQWYSLSIIFVVDDRLISTVPRERAVDFSSGTPLLKSTIMFYMHNIFRLKNDPQTISKSIENYHKIDTKTDLDTRCLPKRSWNALGRFLGATWALLGSFWRPKADPKGAPDGPKIVQKLF